MTQQLARGKSYRGKGEETAGDTRRTPRDSRTPDNTRGDERGVAAPEQRRAKSAARGSLRREEAKVRVFHDLDDACCDRDRSSFSLKRTTAATIGVALLDAILSEWRGLLKTQNYRNAIRFCFCNINVLKPRP